MTCKVSMAECVMWSCALIGCGLLLWLCIISFGYSEKKLLKTLDEELTNSSTTFSNCDYENDDLHRIMSSAERILGFIETHIDELAIDSAIGTRILESQLHLLQLGHSKLPQTFQEKLQFTQNLCKRLSETIIDKFVSKEMPTKQKDQLSAYLYWVNDTSLWESPSIGNWRPESEPNLILLSNVTIETIASEGESMTEDTWNNCTVDIFQECTVTDECAEMFMGKIGSQYSLTHQIFYFLFAEKKNCFHDQHFKRKMGNKSPAEFMYRMCNKVWQEAHAIQKSGFPVLYRDLLMEQVTVCSLLGYTQFLNVSWLKTMLSWQDENGCFVINGVMNSEAATQEGNSTENSTENRDRVKRFDKLIQMGAEKCSVHSTNVAVSAMAMHIRYFGDTCMRNY